MLSYLSGPTDWILRYIESYIYFTLCHVPDQDGAEPSTNSVSALNLLRLSHFIDHKDWRDMAGRTIGAFTQTLEQVPIALPQMLCALLAWHTPMKQVHCVLLYEPKVMN